MQESGGRIANYGVLRVKWGAAFPLRPWAAPHTFRDRLRETFGETGLIVGVHDRGDDELLGVLVLDLLEARHEL